MRKALAWSLLAVFLVGCASDPAPRDISGVWINQAAIDEAAKGGNLREALLAYGPNLEWDIDAKNAKANYTNGFEWVEGKLAPEKKGVWQVDLYGSSAIELSLKGIGLTQAASDSDPQQSFVRSPVHLTRDAPLGTHFEYALKAAYLGGEWRVISGPGQGNTVTFMPDGQIKGLANYNAYALCLAGDCASMSGEYDSLWLQQDEIGAAHLFMRNGRRLEIFQALDSAKPDEMPQFYPGKQEWVLEKQP
ncbi:hypothetical protein NTD86_09625 [Pseudomonas sp. 7P_10.2_Bac1]|uniref:hypothetical protein n=1 Tax=Pseudomonas sp. 7P_10.2_Bac1 TaxID=2971614 RepID=UPI0021C8D5E3|nr:hypothetical protein [Pseudomonas sp. 7P_10.2_Bac1]MCU1727243.1 hypothetical protein [Pseudomonas sp. 7P_10.2_Bac1]